ncbi:TrmB family transcriptional regulator [Candidatus Woesearchaeota archaeon]|jgi:HTH-type transcriptional regulator, sugar sensing transcriptional regulator|nr:TrmB family transcriptional regulator [Candidatus Woesearchaeota archaeon]MBT6045150.1 TrmB family transcriptional regulator [Candidatus Woesearchaeota archaeon]
MDLKLLGLTDYEEKVYITLAKSGKSSAGEISRESNVPYGKIYVILEKLEAKNLVNIIPEKTKKFIATSPKNLIKTLENEENKLKNLKKELKDLKKVYTVHEEEVVRIARGKKNFHKLTRELKETKTFSYTIKYVSEYKGEWIQKNKKHQRKGINTKCLARYDKETKEAVDKWSKLRKDQRIIDNEGIAMTIKDEEVFIALIKSNTLITIRDKPFVKIMKKMYEETYKNAKKVPICTSTT